MFEKVRLIRIQDWHKSTFCAFRIHYYYSESFHYVHLWRSCTGLQIVFFHEPHCEAGLPRSSKGPEEKLNRRPLRGPLETLRRPFGALWYARLGADCPWCLFAARPVSQAFALSPFLVEFSCYILILQAFMKMKYWTHPNPNKTGYSCQYKNRAQKSQKIHRKEIKYKIL